MIALAATASDATVQIVALVVGLVQTVALAVIADRSRRVRRDVGRRESDTAPAPRQQEAQEPSSSAYDATDTGAV